MSKSRILSKLIIPIALLTIYSITLYKTATAPLDPNPTLGTENQTTVSTQALVEVENNNDIPRPPKAPPAPTAALNSPEALHFVALTDPKMVPAAQVNWLEPNDEVLGIVHDGEALAFPLKQMALHHVVNIRINGESFVIVYCMLCGGHASSYITSINDARYTFDIFGINQDGLTIIDRQTRSIWQAANGDLLNGPFSANIRSLRPQVLTQGSWEDWLSLHPDSMVLPQLPEYILQYAKIDNYDREQLPRLRDLFYIDQRLPQDEVVLGISIDDQYLTYKIPETSKKYTVINDSFNGIPFAIFFDVKNNIGAAYLAIVDDRAETFSVVNGKIVDESSSVWDIEGHASSGPHHGLELSSIASHFIRWDYWSAYHPDTIIHSR